MPSSFGSKDREVTGSPNYRPRTRDLLGGSIASFGGLVLTIARWSSGQQIGVCGMPVDEVGDKRTARDDLQALSANVLQYPVHHLRTGAAPAQGGRHFRVGERHHTAGKTVESKRRSARNIHFVAVQHGVLANLTHG